MSERCELCKGASRYVESLLRVRGGADHERPGVCKCSGSLMAER